MTSTNPQPKQGDTDPRWSDFDAFLTAEDLDGKAQTWRITKASIVEVYDQKEKKVVFKPVIHFAGTPKYMFLSPTNRHRLQEAFGNRCANAVGKLVTVKTEKVKAFGKERDVLRLTIPQQVDQKTGEISGNDHAEETKNCPIHDVPMSREVSKTTGKLSAWFHRDSTGKVCTGEAKTEAATVGK